MIYFKHTGIYVNNLCIMSRFYKEVFHLIAICEAESDCGKLYDQLYGIVNARVFITKLISPYGKEKGCGDMLELIQLQDSRGKNYNYEDRRIYQTGMMHIAIGVDNIEEVQKKINTYGGEKITDIITKGIRRCFFCKDPEGNYIEVIE